VSAALVVLISNIADDRNKDLSQVSLKELCQFGRFISFPQR